MSLLRLNLILKTHRGLYTNRFMAPVFTLVLRVLQVDFSGFEHHVGSHLRNISCPFEMKRDTVQRLPCDKPTQSRECLRRGQNILHAFHKCLQIKIQRVQSDTAMKMQCNCLALAQTKDI